MKELSQNECSEINGGNLAMDIGWFLGHMVHGNFGSAYGISMAIADYHLLYMTK